MKAFRTLANKHLAPTVNMGDAVIRQAIPVNGLEQVSPFILLHHFDFTRAAGEHDFNVPPHPHRGFSPVTFMFEGTIRHRDSTGKDEEIGANEVQWINAGRGLIHSEEAGSAMREKGGRMQGIQLWINTPKAHKMDPPVYQPVRSAEIPLIKNGNAEFRLVSGSYAGKKGPADSEVLTAMLRMPAGEKFDLDLPADENAIIYILEGTVKLNDESELPQYCFVSFKREDGRIQMEALKDAKILVLSGKPINEPLVTHGPFVMNSQTEILEAMRDYRENKMGFLY